MKYANTLHGKFIDRPNRFCARVELCGRTETVHVKNTGRLGELLLPGAEVMLAAAENPERKTKYDLISVWREGLGWVNVDSQAPNALVAEWLRRGPEPFGVPDLLKPEYRYGDSRMDFYLESGARKILIEVKGCTLAIGGVGYFPDAPTERGVRHLRELRRAVREGYEAYLAFVIPMEGIDRVLPNRDTHPAFADALAEAEADGVRILYLPCAVRPDEVRIL